MKTDKYPRPDMRRDDWLLLDGEWEFEFDPANPVDGDGFLSVDSAYSEKIKVPFAHQSNLSEIQQSIPSQWLWYRKRFDLPEEWPDNRTFLHFGAVDYYCRVWVNDTFVGEHSGGYTPFHFDVTHIVKQKGNYIVIKVEDSNSLDQPRGKQSWSDPFSCWYTPVSGIWQSVWIESVGWKYIEDIFFKTVPTEKPLQEEVLCLVDITLNMPAPKSKIKMNLAFEGSTIQNKTVEAQYPLTTVVFQISTPELWSPEKPALYGISVSLFNDTTMEDKTYSYTGLRIVSLKEKGLFINGVNYHQKLILDQGYWPEGLYTPKDTDAFKLDIELSKKMGFNGCRMHMKIEDPHFYYWADKLGFIVWSEFPTPFSYTETSRFALMREFIKVLHRDRNHPSIVAWVPYNESWGLATHTHKDSVITWLKELSALVRQIDPTRLFIDNDGWEHVKTDIVTYHSYAATKKELEEIHNELIIGKKPFGKPLWIEKSEQQTLPIMLSEFGGIAIAEEKQHSQSWGYQGIANNKNELKKRISEIFKSAYKLPGQIGFCYTQLTDVEQEVNGLLRGDRTSKLDINWIKSIVTGTSEEI